jgi:hypothetical protein
MTDPCLNCGVKHRSITFEQCQDRKMSEQTLQDRVVGRAKRRGWKVAHAGRGIAAFDAQGLPVFVTQMAKGWPDLFLLRPEDGHRLVIELKKEEGDLEPEQVEWLQAFNACGIPAIMVKPSDLRMGRVNEVLK